PRTPPSNPSRSRRKRTMESSEKWSASAGFKVVTGGQLLRSLRDARSRPPLVTALAPIDQPPDGGLARGSLVELAGPVSGGSFSLLLAALAAATRAGEAAALVDLGDNLDPRNAAHAGVDLQRLLWLRPRETREALVAAETALSAGFSVVALDLAFR